ncbi:MAG: hypothetical protein HOW73_22185 [Polyangiaceae bacterium]|nr:hypothetical protein [Polyangiaceae bacterium]
MCDPDDPCAADCVEDPDEDVCCEDYYEPSACCGNGCCETYDETDCPEDCGYTCDNGVCEGGDEDCGCDCEACGDGYCNYACEDERACLLDCNPCFDCGDGLCEAACGERPSTCPMDCP